MEIIEIGNACVCAKISGEVPKGRRELIGVAEMIFEKCGRRLFRCPEITAYSNGEISLVFISRKMRQNAAEHILHNFVI